MGGSAEERLSWKEPLHSLEVELQREYGLSAVHARALVARVGELLDVFGGEASGVRTAGQVCYPAVAVGERAGKPLRHCVTVPVSLTLWHPDDARLLHECGSPALRRLRAARVCTEAHTQGAVLSHEDVSLLLSVEVSTVRRLLRASAEEGAPAPTRGVVDDIGPSVSHKEQVLTLYFQGLLPWRIAVRTGHALGSVERYLMDFARVAELSRRGLSVEATVRVSGLGPALVRRYLELLGRFDRPEHRPVLERLLARFAPCVPPAEQEVRHG